MACAVLRADEVTATPLPFCRSATFPLIGESTSAPTGLQKKCHSERSEESHFAQSKFDTRVGNNLCVVPQSFIRFCGSSRTPTPTQLCVSIGSLEFQRALGCGSPVETFEYKVFKSTDRAGRRDRRPLRITRTHFAQSAAPRTNSPRFIKLGTNPKHWKAPPAFPSGFFRRGRLRADRRPRGLRRPVLSTVPSLPKYRFARFCGAVQTRLLPF